MTGVAKAISAQMKGVELFIGLLRSGKYEVSG